MDLHLHGSAVYDGNPTIGGRFVGYFDNGQVYAGGHPGRTSEAGWGGKQVGYIDGDCIYAGTSGKFGGKQVGYVDGNDVYRGSSGTFGGTRVGPARFPHPRMEAAIAFLLT